MKILHTEASNGWGGQEIRTLKEALGMRDRGHELIFAVVKGATIAEKAREEGFTVYELPYSWKKLYRTLPILLKILRKEKIDIINTHSSLDAWLAGIAARLSKRKVIRTRHLSTPIRPGWNSRVLYHHLADFTATTCEEVAGRIRHQADLPVSRCCSIPTGVNFSEMDPSCTEEFRKTWGIGKEDIVVGTACILRSWKGINDLLDAAHLLKDYPHLKWLIVGNGPCYDRYRQQAKNLQLENVIFTGFLKSPYTAIAAMDIFALLSTNHEGVSQASLQAAYLKKPLITTSTGGLPEVCIPNQTGFIAEIGNPQEVATRLATLLNNAKLRDELGQNAHNLVIEKFTFKKTLDDMEKVYKTLV